MAKRLCPICNDPKKKHKNPVYMPYIPGKGWVCLQCGNTNPFLQIKGTKRKHGKKEDRDERGDPSL